MTLQYQISIEQCLYRRNPQNLEGLIIPLFLGPNDPEDKIKDIPGGMEIIRKFPDGDCIKIYSDLINDETSVGYQPNGTSHEEYKENNIIKLPNNHDESE